MKISKIVPVVSPYEGYLQERFRNHFAQISTETMLRLRSSVKDVHRVLDGKVPPEIEAMCKKFPIPPQGITDKDFTFGYTGPDGDPVKGVLETDVVIQEYVKKYPNHWAIVVRCLGQVRQSSVHACATVITDEPVTNFLPTSKVGSCQNPVTQYTANSVEGVGGVKYDFLGVKSLLDIQIAVRLIQQANRYDPQDEKIDGARVPGMRVIPHQTKRGLEKYDIWDLPEDPAVFYDICSGQTETVFQFGTGSAKQWLKEFFVEGVPSLRSVKDLATFTALDRPGPLDAYVEDAEKGIKRNILQEFASRARGEEPVGDNPTLNSMIPETYGAICFQEQVQKVFQVVGQTTPEQADDFRIHVGKKKLSEIAKDRELFLPGATKTLGSLEEADRVFSMMATFGKYAFNLSHAVCYAYTGYVCAWLKHYYPVEWWTAVLRNADRNEIDGNFWKYVGHLVDPPDVALSENDWAIQNGRIRAPLRFLKGVGESAHNELVEILPFTAVREFMQKIYDRRVRLSKEVTKEKTDKKTGETKQITTTSLGRSALNRSILTKLVVSGVADSLFPPDCQDVFSKLTMVSQVRSEIEGKKPEKVDESYLNISPLQRYQLRKSILPTYTANLLPMVATALPDTEFRIDGKMYHWLMGKPFGSTRDHWGRDTGDGQTWCPMVGGKICRSLLEPTKVLDGIPPQFKFGVACYVMGTEWFWNNKAVKISFDVEGERFELPKWPSKKDKEDGKKVGVPEGLASSIAIITFSRWSADRPFSIDDIRIVQGMAKEKADEE